MKVKTYSDFQEAIVQNKLDAALDFIKIVRENSGKNALDLAIEMIETIVYRNRSSESDGPEESESCQYEDLGDTNVVPTVEEKHNPANPFGWIEESLKKNSNRVKKGKIYRLNIESRRYVFPHEAPEILVYSPVYSAPGVDQWGLIAIINQNMISRTYNTEKGAKIAAQRFLMKCQSPFDNQKRKNTWVETDKSSPRVNWLVAKGKELAIMGSKIKLTA